MTREPIELEKDDAEAEEISSEILTRFNLGTDKDERTSR